MCDLPTVYVRRVVASCLLNSHSVVCRLYLSKTEKEGTSLALKPGGCECACAARPSVVWTRANSRCSGPDALTPCPLLQVAIIAGNFELAEYIKNHKETDIGEYARRGGAPSGTETLPAFSGPHEAGSEPAFSKT